MQKFFICTTSIVKGPYALDDLIKHDLNERDLIWSSEWRKTKYAYQVQELKNNFKEKWNKKNHLKPAKKFVFNKKFSIVIVMLTIFLSILFYYFF